MMIIGGATVVFLGLVYYLLGDMISFKKADSESNTITTVLPDAEYVELSESKSDIYRAKTQKERDAEFYFAGLGRESMDETEDISLTSESVSSKIQQSEGKSPQEAMEALFPNTITEDPIPSVKPTSARKNVSRGGSSSRKSSATVAPMTDEEKMEFDRKRAEMMRDVLIGKEVETASRTESEPILRIETSTMPSAKPSSGIISSLDDDVLEDPIANVVEDRPVRCIFVRDEKIRTGQRVTIRILEDLMIDGLLIPANSHLSATCTIGGRLSMRVTSIEQRGKIYGLSLDAYDIDGGLGIYCPETGSTRNNSTIKNNAVTAATSTLGGMVGRVAGTIVNTGASLVRNSSGDVTVSISSGYEFYIMKTTKR